MQNIKRKPKSCINRNSK